MLELGSACVCVWVHVLVRVWVRDRKRENARISDLTYKHNNSSISVLGSRGGHGRGWWGFMRERVSYLKITPIIPVLAQTCSQAQKFSKGNSFWQNLHSHQRWFCSFMLSALFRMLLNVFTVIRSQSTSQEVTKLLPVSPYQKFG